MVFNSKDIKFIVNSVPVKGFSGDGIVKIEPQTGASELISGVNNETIFISNSKIDTKISFSLFQSSESNGLLWKLSLFPIPVMAVLIKSVKPIEYIGFGISARVSNRPIVELKQSQQNYIWEIIISDWYSKIK